MPRDLRRDFKDHERVRPGRETAVPAELIEFGQNGDQGIIGRLLGYGTLRIAGAGNFDPIPNVSAPLAFKKAVLESQEAFRNTYRAMS